MVENLKVFMKLRLGVHSDIQYWAVRDYCKGQRALFAHMVGLFKCFCILGEVLQHQIQDEHMLATMWTVQGLKAILQCALDGGGWGTASLVLPDEDSSARTPFCGHEGGMRDLNDGGHPRRCEIIHAAFGNRVVVALRGLARRTSRGRPSSCARRSRRLGRTGSGRRSAGRRP